MVQFKCKSKALSRTAGELLAKYYPLSTEKDMVEEECWELFHIKDMISNLRSENHEIRRMFADNIGLSSEAECLKDAVVSFMKCECQEIFDMILEKCGCKVRSKFDEKVNYLVIDFSKVTSKTLPKISEKVQKVKEKNEALKVFSLSDFMSVLLLSIEKRIDSGVNCIYGRFEGDESGDCLEVAEDGTINVTCVCGLDSDDAYQLAEENEEDVEYYMSYVNEESCVYSIADALRYIISKMDKMYKWTGRINEANVLTAEENELLSILGEIVETEDKKYCYSRNIII